MQRACYNRTKHAPRDTDHRLNGLLQQRPRALQSVNPQRDVVVPLISWENDRGVGEATLPMIGTIFERLYGFAVSRFQIPLQNSQAAVEEELRNYESVTSNSGSLFILYYLGHGGVQPNTHLHLSNDSNSTSILDWSTLQEQLMGLPADILVLLEACDAAGAAFAARKEKKREGRMEIIASSTFPGTTWLEGPEPFNRALYGALRENAEKGAAFTIATLYHDILLQHYKRIIAKFSIYRTRYLPLYTEHLVPQIPSSSIHLNLTADTQLPLIQLKPLRRRPQLRCFREPRLYGDLDLEELELDWAVIENEEEVRRYWDRVDGIRPL